MILEYVQRLCLASRECRVCVSSQGNKASEPTGEREIDHMTWHRDIRSGRDSMGLIGTGVRGGGGNQEIWVCLTTHSLYNNHFYNTYICGEECQCVCAVGAFYSLLAWTDGDTKGPQITKCMNNTLLLRSFNAVHIWTFGHAGNNNDMTFTVWHFLSWSHGLQLHFR